jgi:hypothetical protein
VSSEPTDSSLSGGEKSERFWPVYQNTKINKQSKQSTSLLVLQLLMARIRTRKSRARHFTPPDLKHTQKLKHPRTPSRCGVLWAKAFSQELGITIKQDII